MLAKITVLGGIIVALCMMALSQETKKSNEFLAQQNVHHQRANINYNEKNIQNDKQNSGCVKYCDELYPTTERCIFGACFDNCVRDSCVNNCQIQINHGIMPNETQRNDTKNNCTSKCKKYASGLL